MTQSVTLFEKLNRAKKLLRNVPIPYSKTASSKQHLPKDRYEAKICRKLTLYGWDLGEGPDI